MMIDDFLSTQTMAARPGPTLAHACAGFTLIEMVMVMVITAILAIGTVKFIDGPVQGYVQTNVRAELTDIADTALRRIGRDVRAALPNSVRLFTNGNGTFVEYLNTKTGAMYQTNDACFTTAGCNTVTSLGSVVPEASLAVTDFVVINNFSNNSDGLCGNCSAYCAAATALNKAQITNPLPGTGGGVEEDTITFTKTSFCPSAVENSRRFQIVDGPVTYVCHPTANGGDGTLRRYSGYAIQAAQPVSEAAAPLLNRAFSILATNVTTCNFFLYPNSGLLALQLSLTHTTTPFESVSLYHEIHISTSP